MADELKFLLGFGERLTEPVPPPGGGNATKSPYTGDEARDRLVPLLSSTSDAFGELPDDAGAGQGGSEGGLESFRVAGELDAVLLLARGELQRAHGATGRDIGSFINKKVV